MTIDVPPDPRGPGRLAARRRARGTDLDAEGAAAEVLLRRPRQRAVRGHHPAAGVLPDPRRGEHPRAHGPPRSPTLTKARTLVELGSGSSEKTHLLLRALRDVGSLESYVPVDVSVDAIERAMPGLVADYPGLDVHGVVADFERHLDRLPDRRPAAGRVPRRHDRQLRARASGPPSWPRSAPPSSRATRCCSAPTWSRTRTGWSGRTTTPPASPPQFNLNVLHVINRELGADFDVDRFEHVAVWDAERGVDRDAAALARRADGRRARPGPDRGLRGRRGDAHRDLGEVPRRTWSPPSSPRPGCVSPHWWTDEPATSRSP